MCENRSSQKQSLVFPCYTYIVISAFRAKQSVCPAFFFGKRRPLLSLISSPRSPAQGFAAHRAASRQRAAIEPSR